MARSPEHDLSMSPGFLVASPRLDGGPFERAVILLVHHDQRGAMGYIINKPVDVDFGTLIASVNAKIQPRLLADSFDKTVYFGGPMRIEQLWILYKYAENQPPTLGPASGFSRPMPAELPQAVTRTDGFFDPQELAFSERWALSASGRVIEDFAMHPTDDYFMPVLGYAGWGAGQLEAEIGQGSWLLADFDDSLIFEANPAECWSQVLGELGVDPYTFLMMGKVGQA